MYKPTLNPRGRRSALCGSVVFILFAGVVGLISFVGSGTLRGGAEDQADQESTPQFGSLARRLRCLAKAGVERWHARGHRGRGVKVAILDSGFRNYREQLGKSLPSQVVVKSFRADGNLEARDSQHGILCGEVVHALAPDAEILLINWEPDSPERFLDAVRWSRQQGAQIISCSVIMPSWSDGEGGGPIHTALTQILGKGSTNPDVLFFASAGNTAKRHWSGTFRDHGDGWHEWKPGVTENTLYPWGKERVSVELCWSGTANYDLYVYEGESAVEVARSIARPGEQRCSAVARFQADPAKRYSFRVKASGPNPAPFHCVALHSGLEHFSTRGSICFPADGPEVLAIGAVDENLRRMYYSSCGPNSICPKPNLVASVPFPSLWREKPFAGTSAASPQAAGVAAVLWSRNINWPADKVKAALHTSAQDLGTPGHDVEFGYGLLRLPDDDKP